jgi:hypothetical protein
MEVKPGELVKDIVRPDPTPRWSSTTPYGELKTGQIRLLRISTEAKGISGSLRCTLTVHDLEAAPSFTALSYTWGAPHEDIDTLRTEPSSTTRRINCNGNEAEVGDNLYDFLAHCASHPSEHSSGYLWIDALAINQGDLQERCEQVILMRKIYQRAIGVVVWLGPEDCYTESAVKLMKEFLDLDQQDRLRLHHTEVREDHPNSLLKSRNWQALAQFFRREWFNRTWM